MDTEELGRRGRSRRSGASPSCSPSLEHAGHDLAVLAPGGDHEDDPVAVGRGLGHGPAGRRWTRRRGGRGSRRGAMATATRPRAAGDGPRGRRSSLGATAPRLGQHLVGVLAGVGRRAAGCPPAVRLKRGAASGCGMPATSTKVSAGHVVRVRRRLVHATGPGRSTRRCPPSGRTTRHGSSPCMTRVERSLRISGHGAAVHLVGLVGHRPLRREQLGVELRLDRADGHVLAVGALVDVVEVRAACRAGWCPARPSQTPMAMSPWMKVMSTAAPSTMAASTTWPSPERLASTSAADDAEGQQHAAAAEVADQVERRRWGASPARPIGCEGAGEGDVVDVVAGRLGVGAVLAPAGHAAVDERAGCGRGRRRDRSPSRSATPGRKPSISTSAFSTSRSSVSTPVGVLQVDADRAAAPGQDVAWAGRPDRRPSPPPPGRRGSRRRPCRPASSRRTDRGRCRRSRRPSPPRVDPCRASYGRDSALMILHTAGPADLDVPTLYALLKLRTDVFVVEQACPYPELDDRDLEAGTEHRWFADDHGADRVPPPAGRARRRDPSRPGRHPARRPRRRSGPGPRRGRPGRSRRPRPGRRPGPPHRLVRGPRLRGHRPRVPRRRHPPRPHAPPDRRRRSSP